MSRRLRSVLFAFLLMSLVTGRVAAQVQLSRLDGVVVDAANRPVDGAAVIVSDPLGATIRRVTVDASGRFLIGDLPPGRYQLTVDAGGAVSPGVSVTVADGLPASVTLRLPPAFRDAVVVEGVRPAASIATRTSLGADSIARTPVRAGSSRLQDVVATLPGWATEDNGLLHSRGVDDGFLYVVDGVPVYERLDRTSGVAPDASTNRRAHRRQRLRAAGVRPQGRRRHRGADPRRGERVARPGRDRRRQRRRRGGRRRGRRRAGPRRDVVAARGWRAIVALPRSGGPGQPAQPRRRPLDGGAAHRRFRRARSRHGELERRRRAFRRAEHGRAGGCRPGAAAAAGTGRAHRLLAARLVGRDGVAARRLRPPQSIAARPERIRHAADGDIRSSPDADRRPRRRHASDRCARGQGGRRGAAAAPRRAVRLRRHRRGRRGRGRLERGGVGVRP